MMEKEGKSSQKGSSKAGTDTDLLLQWGNRKRLRCVKVKKGQNLTNNNNNNNNNKSTTDCLPKKKITSSRADKEFPSPQQPNRLNKNSDLPMNSRRSLVASPEKEDRYYTTRGSLGFDDNGKVLMDTVKEDKGLVWPRLYITLSSKEKEEDFMAMKGCKPPQRPKKRAKLIQRSLLLVSPGAWLSDLCQERYEVREKKTSRKRPRGLKAMGSMESDSE